MLHTGDSFRLYDTPCAPVCHTDVSTDKVVDNIKVKLSQLVSYDSDNVKHLLLPHIDGVLTKLIQPCEAMADDAHQSVSKMEQVIPIAPNEKLQKQNAPKSMRRVSRKAGISMLPKLDFQEKQRVLAELSQPPPANIEDGITCENDVSINVSTVGLKKKFVSKVDRNRLSLRGKLSKQIVLNESTHLTVPIGYELQNLSTTILSLGGANNLSMITYISNLLNIVCQ